MLGMIHSDVMTRKETVERMPSLFAVAAVAGVQRGSHFDGTILGWTQSNQDPPWDAPFHCLLIIKASSGLASLSRMGALLWPG